MLYASDEQLIGQPVAPPESPDIQSLTSAVPACRWQIEYHLNRRLLTEDIHRLRDRLLLIFSVTLVAMALATWLTSRRISRPVGQMLAQMDRVQQGDLTARVPAQGHDELSDLSKGLQPHGQPAGYAYPPELYCLHPAEGGRAGRPADADPSPFKSQRCTMKGCLPAGIRDQSLRKQKKT